MIVCPLLVAGEVIGTLNIARMGGDESHFSRDEFELVQLFAALQSQDDLVGADIRDPAAVLGSPEVAELLDLSRPVGLLHVGILHHVNDDEDPYGVLEGYVRHLAPGSHVAVSHFFTPADGSPLAERAAAVESVLLGGELGRGRFRTRPEIQRFFDGLEMVEPGLTHLARWWPDGPPPELGLHRLIMLGGLARKA